MFAVVLVAVAGVGKVDDDEHHRRLQASVPGLDTWIPNRRKHAKKKTENKK